MSRARKRPLTPLQRDIVATIARARREGLEPKSFYFNDADWKSLGSPDAIDGLPVRRLAGRSRLYCRHGIQRMIRADRPPYERPPP